MIKKVGLLLMTVFFLPLWSEAGISGNSGFGVKRRYVTERVCDGEYNECRMVRYPVIPPEEMSADKEPFCFNYDRRPDEPCLMYYVYPGGS